MLSFAACFFSSSTLASSVPPSGIVAAEGGKRAQQQHLPEWHAEVVEASSETSNGGDSQSHSSPVDVDELATWFSPALVEETRKSVVSVSPVGRGLDIDAAAGPAAGSGGVLLDPGALLVGSRGRSQNSALAAAVPAGTRFVLTSRRAVSSGFASYEIALVDGRKAAAKLVYIDAFYPVAVLVVVEDKGEGDVAAALAAGAGSPLVAAATAAARAGDGDGAQKVDPATLPFAKLYPPPEDDTRVIGSWGAGGATTEAAAEQESSSNSSSSVVVVEPNDPLLFLGHAPEKGATTTFIGYVSDLRAAFPKSRSAGRGIRGAIARALVARKSPGPGGGAFDVSGRLFGLDVDRDIRGVVAASDKKAEVYVLPSIYLRDALARAVSGSLRESLLRSSDPKLLSSLLRPRADGGFAATLVPLGIAVDRYKLDKHIAEMLRGEARISGWPNAGGTVPKVIKVTGVDAGNEGEENEGGVRAGDIVVGVVEDGTAAPDGKGSSSVTRFLGDDLHALDDAFSRAVLRARAHVPLAADGVSDAQGWGPEPEPASPSASSSFLARPSPAFPEATSASPPDSAPAVVRLVVSRFGELLTVPATVIGLDASPAKIERVALWARCRFADPPVSARRLYQFAGPGVALASCDPESPLSAVVNADPREEDEAPTTSGAPPPSRTPVLFTSIGGAPTPDLDALVKLLSSKSSPAGSNTTVAYRSIHTGRDSYAYVEGVSFASSREAVRQFVFVPRARRWVLLATPFDGGGGAKAKALSFSAASSPSLSSLLPLGAEEFKARAAPAKNGSSKGKGQASAASVATSAASDLTAFVSRGETAKAASSLLVPSFTPSSPFPGAAAAKSSAEDPRDGGEEAPSSSPEEQQQPLGKPSSLSEAATADLLSLAAKALGRAPVHASQSVWGSPEALSRIKQQAVQVSINDALPLEHTDAMPSAVGTGFVVEAKLGIIATVRRIIFIFDFSCSLSLLSLLSLLLSHDILSASSISNKLTRTRTPTSAARRSEGGRSCSSTVRLLRSMFSLSF